MKKLTLLFILSMASMLVFAQSPADSVGGGITKHRQGLASEDNPPPDDNVTLDPHSWDFGQVAVDFAYDKVFTLTNNRNNNITITGIQAIPRPPFSVVETTCHITLGAGDSCTITVQVDAESPGLKSGTLTVDCDGAPECPFTSTLTATAVPDVTVSPSSCYLLSSGIGIPGPPCVITLMNNTPYPLYVSIGTSSPFSQINNCGPSLRANSSCTIDVVYTPVEYGIVTGTLSIETDSRDGTPPSVNLTGELVCIWPPHCEAR